MEDDLFFYLSLSLLDTKQILNKKKFKDTIENKAQIKVNLNRHKKNCSESWITRKMQMETTMC